MVARRRESTEEEILAEYDARMNAICDKVDSGKLSLKAASRLALSASSKVPLKHWNFLAIVGKLWAGYELRFHHAWVATPDMRWDSYQAVMQLVLEFGPGDVMDGIDLLYSPEMKWVEDPMRAIVRRNFFIKCIIPKLHKHRADSEKTAGEQVEAEGGREGPGSREVTI